MCTRGVVVIAMVAACGGGEAKPDAAVIYEDAALCVPGAQTSTVYLNFTGGTFSHGLDDATLNRADPIDTTRTLAAWPLANAAGIKACVEAALKPFKIDVTDVDPGQAPHHEIVFSDVFWVAADPQVRTISASNCGGTIQNTISFVFAAPIGDSAVVACHDAMLQFGVASTGLDHVNDCTDYLSGGAVPACGPRAWTTTPLQCGDGGNTRPCHCGGSHQISMNKMRDRFGLSCAP